MVEALSLSGADQHGDWTTANLKGWKEVLHSVE